MSTQTHATNTDDDEQPKKPAHNKGRSLQPLHEEEIKKQLENNADFSKANGDVLAELAAKTAELAEKVQGPEGPKERVLRLDDPETAEPTDIFAALDEITETTQSTSPSKSSDPNPAADIIREKLQRLYGTEPDATTEAAEAVATVHRSKHQQYMYDLTTSGRSLADIQTAWHNYYTSLDDEQKHQVWQEFYANQTNVSAFARHDTAPAQKQPNKSHKPGYAKRKLQPLKTATKDPKEIKNQLLDKISAGGKLKPVHHAKSALFGIGLAAFVGLFITFVFFNEVFVAPLISPSRTVSATPIIGELNESVSQEPKIIIPKINLEVPVVFDVGTVAEDAIQDALEDGVVHYAASPEPGQQGNSVIVGHSSNNILNSGRYKFAFVLLNRLEAEDTFFVHKDGIRYTYKVFEKKVVSPTEISVLGPSSRDNTMTLITCDPPGTTINRLVIVAEQISPNPAENAEPTINIEPELEVVPGNAPSLWSRLTGWL